MAVEGSLCCATVFFLQSLYLAFCFLLLSLRESHESARTILLCFFLSLSLPEKQDANAFQGPQKARHSSLLSPLLPFAILYYASLSLSLLPFPPFFFPFTFFFLAARDIIEDGKRKQRTKNTPAKPISPHGCRRFTVPLPLFLLGPVVYLKAKSQFSSLSLLHAMPAKQPPERAPLLPISSSLYALSLSLFFLKSIYFFLVFFFQFPYFGLFN